MASVVHYNQRAFTVITPFSVPLDIALFVHDMM